MNERIRLLKHQASLWCDENIPEQFSEETNGYGRAWEDKFAELIVRECADQCDLLLDHKMSSEWSRGTHDCSRAIKKYFGVE